MDESIHSPPCYLKGQGFTKNTHGKQASLAVSARPRYCTSCDPEQILSFLTLRCFCFMGAYVKSRVENQSSDRLKLEGQVYPINRKSGIGRGQALHFPLTSSFLLVLASSAGWGAGGQGG